MKRLALALCALVIVLPVGLRSSGATFVASTTNPAASFSAAGDFNTVAVTLADPGTPVHGSITLAATATSTRGIATVRFQTSAAGADTWTDVCTDTGAPYTCALDASSVADGLRDVRALATDAAGYQRSATVASRRFDNTAPSITLSDPGDAVRDVVTLQATASDGAGTGIASVRYQWRPANLSFWIDLCTVTTAPYSCAGDTRWLPDGSYEARAIATDGVGLTTTSDVVGGRVDNTDPTAATLNDPGTTLSGTETLSGTATDAGSGIASLRFEYAPAGTGSWSTACSAGAAPYSCSWTTTGVADGLYDLRSVATDVAGNTLTSSVRSGRRVDNTAPSVSLTNPGTPLRGSVSLSATATDAGGIATVTFEQRLEGASTWTAICSKSTSPYTCAWDTTALADARYDLRATAVDVAGNTTTSAVVSSRQVDNPPRGVDVQPANGSGTAHKIDAGDTLTFTWSESIAPSSILAGWNGTAKQVTLRVTNAGTSDTLSLWDSANTTRLNVTSASQELQLQANRTTATPTTFKANAVLSGAQLQITVVSLSAGSVTTVTPTAALAWTPSAGATDLTGNAAATTLVTQSAWTAKDF